MWMFIKLISWLTRADLLPNSIVPHIVYTHIVVLIHKTLVLSSKKNIYLQFNEGCSLYKIVLNESCSLCKWKL